MHQSGRLCRTLPAVHHLRREGRTCPLVIFRSRWNARGKKERKTLNIEKQEQGSRAVVSCGLPCGFNNLRKFTITRLWSVICSGVHHFDRRALCKRLFRTV